MWLGGWRGRIFNPPLRWGLLWIVLWNEYIFRRPELGRPDGLVGADCISARLFGLG
ncbi:hypothetical protein [Neisseria montereyensis]|uniref:Uncharacterized protein n=1 Tax=Neisseria montereyensis TaxID=2973938 RepID=A0ABT2FAF2_9NEIS|nr:hypothetical protein [Neisseria montereyensis]MCS4533194.1 hypothetical protein [Neisseria montereyensis]